MTAAVRTTTATVDGAVYRTTRTNQFITTSTVDHDEKNTNSSAVAESTRDASCH